MEHGYLSPDEGLEGGRVLDELENLDEYKEKLAGKVKEYNERRERLKKREKITKLKPNIYGPKWEVPIQDEEELANPFFKYLLRGIVFDYSKLKNPLKSECKNESDDVKLKNKRDENLFIC